MVEGPPEFTHAESQRIKKLPFLRGSDRNDPSDENFGDLGKLRVAPGQSRAAVKSRRRAWLEMHAQKLRALQRWG
jgi:hypothetical protein